MHRPIDYCHLESFFSRYAIIFIVAEGILQSVTATGTNGSKTLTQLNRPAPSVDLQLQVYHRLLYLLAGLVHQFKNVF